MQYRPFGGGREGRRDKLGEACWVALFKSVPSLLVINFVLTKSS